MKKELAIVTVLSIGLASVIAANAQENRFYPHGFYIGAGGSYNHFISDISMSQVPAYSLDKNIPGAYADLGYALPDLPLQFDVSYAEVRFSGHDGKPIVDGNYLKEGFFNATFNGNFGWSFIPFLTAGYGLTNAGYSGSDSNWNTAWQAGGGAHFRLTNNLMVDAGVNYQSLYNGQQRVVGTQIKEKDTATQFKLGITYFFADQHNPSTLVS